MAKSVAAAASNDSFGSRMKAWPERVKSFLQRRPHRNAEGDRSLL